MLKLLFLALTAADGLALLDGAAASLTESTVAISGLVVSAVS
jgi:hypothetical protein